MTEGFNKPRVILNKDKLNGIIRKYKKIKKYMRSNLFTVKTIDGSETYVSELIKEAEEDPPFQ
jgi:hypothetical protein